jgi:hypothetical protein
LAARSATAAGRHAQRGHPELAEFWHVARAAAIEKDGANARAASPEIRMNYELAKQLKEAGFPQEQRDGTFLRRDDPYAPTLEELIES